MIAKFILVVMALIALSVSAETLTLEVPAGFKEQLEAKICSRSGTCTSQQQEFILDGKVQMKGFPDCIECAAGIASCGQCLSQCVFPPSTNCFVCLAGNCGGVVTPCRKCL